MGAFLKMGLLSLLLLGGATLAEAQLNGNQGGQGNGVSRQASGSDGSRRNDTNFERLGALCDSLQSALNLTDIDVVPLESSGQRQMKRFDEAALRQTLTEMYAALGIEAELPSRFKPSDLSDIFSEILVAAAESTPSVQTLVADGFTTSLAILRGAVTNDGNQDLTAWGFKFGTDSDLGDSIHVAFGDYQSFLDTSAQDTGAFMFEKSGLDRYTTYYYAAWAENTNGIEHGDTLSFTTLPDLASGLVLDTSLVTATSATLELSISDAGGQGPDEVGFYWDDADFTLDAFAGDSLPSDSASGTAHSVQVSGLTRMTTYYFNAYADNLAGRAWADDHFAFTTKPEVPEFDTVYADLTVDSLYALLADDGGQTPSLSRFFYSTTSSAELITDSVDGVLNGLSFSAPIASASLLPSQDYDLNAFVENAAGRATAEAASFFTPALVFTNDSVADITDSTASLMASFTFGNRVPDAFGFKWGLAADLSDATVSPVALAADSTIRLDLSGLSKDSTYHFAAYADNGTVQFGDTSSFLAMTIYAPTVLADTAQFITSTRTTLDGAIDFNGGADVTGYGFIWGTDASLADATEVEGDSTSATSFSKALIGLDPETTYYYAAYATNAVGTGYSDTLSFTTPGTVTFDGFTYSLVKLDTSYWFVESLRNTHFANGDEIPHMPDTDEWSSTFFPGYSNPAGDDSTKVNDWGRLYNYYAYEDTRGICPTDWHPASYSDLNGMRMTLDLDDEADFRSSAEDSPAWDGTNRTGFSALPVGYRTNAGNYSSTEGYAGSEANLFWVSLWGGKARFFRLISSWMPLGGELASSPEQLRAGYSIRCVQGAPDTGGDLPLVTTSGASDTTAVSISLTGVMTDGGTGYVSALGFVWSTDPGLADPQFVATYTTTAPFTMSIEDLEPSTTYYYAAFGRNGWGTAYGDTLSFTTGPWECGSTWDYNDVTYQTVEAFGDCWFTQNLATDRFANGDSIPTGLSETDWEMTLDPAWTALGENAEEQANYVETYGALYNFLAVNDARGLCPTGWHVASSQEWWDLKDSLVDPSSASEIKAIAPAWDGTNETGINLLPSGYYRPNISYDNTDGEMRAYVSQGYEEYAHVWTASASQSGAPVAYYIGDFLNGGQFSLIQMGRTVRCVQGDMGPVEVLAPVIQPQHVRVDSTGATAAVIAFGITEGWGNAITQAKVRIGEDRITTETFNALSLDADTIQIEVTDLSPGTQYWYQPIVYSGDKIGYGYWQTFTTPLDFPTMGTLEATDLAPISATLNGSVDGNGGEELSVTGFIWGTNASLDTTTSVAGSGTSGSFTAALTGLDPVTTYYYSAFGTNSVGTAYGDTLSFDTPSSIAPEVTTSEATDISAFTGVLNGTVGYDGGAEVTATGFVWSADSMFTTPQDIAGSATSGDFSAEIMGLTLDSTYYYTAYATNEAGTAYGDTLSFTAAEPPFLCGSAGTLNYNGHDYGTIHRGNQCWFSENLRTETYANGDNIPMVTSGWNTTTTAARTPMDNDVANVELYGWLYNWYAVADTVRGLCPTDWHVSTDEDWQVLEDGLGATYAGRSLKSKSTDTPPWNGYNSIGFSALPGGYRTEGGTHTNGGVHGYFWTSTEATSTKAWDRYIYNGENGVNRNSYTKRGALSVRCVKFYPARPPATVSMEAEVLGQTSAKLYGTTLANGGGNVTSRGFKYSTDPDLANPTTKTASGADDFNATVTGLSIGTTYYYTAYASNTYGTGYGDTLSFTTDDYYPPVVSTQEGTVEYRQLTLNGSYTNDGGTEITAVGFMYSTDSDLQGATQVNDSTLNETFQNVLELEPNTSYYFTAFATSSAGTSYGDTLTATTSEYNLPVASTLSATVEYTRLTVVGSYTNEGGSEVTAAGFLYSENADLQGAIQVNDSSGSSSFVEILDLQPETTYYVTAFATSIAGTAYGDTLTATTTAEYVPGDPLVFQGNTFTVSKFGTQVWMDSNLETETYANGDTIGSVWGLPNVGAQGWVDDDPAAGAGRGRLYNGHAAKDPRGVCPTGWHISTNDDFRTLIANTAWIENEDGTHTYDSDWQSRIKSSPSDVPSWNGTNTTGLSFPPTGYRWSNGAFYAQTTESKIIVRVGDGMTWQTINEAGTSFSANNTTTAWDNYGGTIRCVMDPCADENENGVCDFEDVEGCTNNNADNYNPDATVDNGECVYASFEACGFPFVFNGVGYSTVQIGDQCWFAENLRTSVYADGTAIPDTASDASGQPLQMNYDSFELSAKFGKSYNLAAVNDPRGLCPTGWEVPTSLQFQELINYAGGASAAGAALKAAPSDGRNWDGTNDYGFGALGGGMGYGPTGGVSNYHRYGRYWARNTNWYDTGYYYEGWTAPAGWSGSSQGGYIKGTQIRMEQAVNSTSTYGENPYVGSSVRCICTDSNENGICDLVDVYGCMDVDAENFNPAATYEDGTCTFAPLNACGDVLGHNGYGYETVQIGDQCWFAENLRTTKYADGTTITDFEETDLTQVALTRGYSDLATTTLYGQLYNGYAVRSDQGLCPSGWHLPSGTEWTELRSFLGSGVDGLAMKSSPEDVPDWDGTNTSGFSALPTGRANEATTYYNMGNLYGYAYYWSTDESSATNNSLVYVRAGNNSVSNTSLATSQFASVRCLKD